MLSDEQKIELKKSRLLEYEGRIFSLQMDLVALESIGATKEELDETKRKIDSVRKAYRAVQEMN